MECFNELCKVNYNDISINEFEITINIYKRIKDQEKIDGDCYIKIKIRSKKRGIKNIKRRFR